MKVEQIYQIINDITSEALGESAILSEDLSNIVDIGNALFDNMGVDAYVRKLVDHIGRVIFVDRVYNGSVPSVLRDAWEYGAACEKITVDLPEAEENETWNLQDRASYDPNIFYKPSVSVKFYNKRVTFEIPYSFTEIQVRGSFSNGVQMNAFLSMLRNAVQKSMTVKIDELIMRGINSMIADTIYDDYAGASLSSKSGVKAVNLLYIYNTDIAATPITADDALVDPDYLRFAAYTMGMYENRLSRLSTLFNIGGKDRFTPTELLHFVLLNDFAKAADVYLQSDTFHNEFTRLPNAEIVPYWQGSGTTFDFSDTSAIDVVSAGGNTVSATGILGVMFDRDAIGVANLSQRTKTNYNPKAEFWSNWAKFETGIFQDENENFVVFFVA